METDMAVQRGTNHAWLNITKTRQYVLQDAARILVDGKPLEKYNGRMPGVEASQHYHDLSTPDPAQLIHIHQQTNSKVSHISF